jgi:DNA-binding MarR family transcriptional regulator
MDAVMFSLKRAFHKSIEAGLVLTTPFGLTPARFDLLHALVGTNRDRTMTRQCTLARQLGVSAPTVSIMVTALERLGLVERLRDEKGRTCGLMITEKGKKCITAALHALLDRGVVHRMLRACWPKEPKLNAKAVLRAKEAAMQQLVGALGYLRRELGHGDWSYLDYPIVVSKARREIALEAVSA